MLEEVIPLLVETVQRFDQNQCYGFSPTVHRSLFIDHCYECDHCIMLKLCKINRTELFEEMAKYVTDSWEV